MSKKQLINSTKINELPAIKELPLKLKNERKLATSLRSLFRDMGDFVRVEIETNGLPPTLNSFNQDMNFTLRKGYRDTANTFKGNIRKELNLGRVGSQQIDQNINTFINQISQQRAGEIINTTNDVAVRSFNKAIEEAAAAGVELNQERLAQKASKEFNKRNANRVGTIATSEVQEMAEATKQIEASTVKGLGELKDAQKMWDATLDQKTRINHAVADGQRVDIDDPFTVGGELLMYPGDRSLGASAGNVINCRCTSRIIFV